MVDFDFANSGPDPRLTVSDLFSVRWTGTLSPSRTGVHRFWVNSGATDGVRLSINSIVQIDTMSAPNASPAPINVTLTAGQPVQVVLEYGAGPGNSRISFQWMQPDLYRSPVPEEALSPPPQALATGGVAAGLTGALWERFGNSGATNLNAVRRDSRWIADQPDSSIRLVGSALTLSPGIQLTAQSGRVRGWLVPPTSGLYQFSLFGTALAELRLSRSRLTTDLLPLATLQASRSATAQGPASTAVYLRQGERYAFEITYLFATPTAIDRLGLAWRTPTSQAGSRFLPVPMTAVAAPVPVVTMSATVSQTNESPAFGTGGLVELQRSGDLGRALRVFYTVGGSAVNGIDYRRLTGTATFQPGQSTLAISIRSLHDSVIEGGETVVIRLLTANEYQLGDESERQATITIRGEVPALPDRSLVPVRRLSDVGDASFEVLPIQDPSVPERTATRIDVRSFQREFDVSMRWQVDADINVNDSMLISFYARVIQSTEPYGLITTRLQLAGPPYNGTQETFDIREQWQQFLLPFRATNFFRAGTATFELRFGHLDQTVEVAGAKLYNFRGSVPPAQLPSVVNSYAGREASSSWRKAADIETKTFRDDPLILSLPGVAPGTRVTLQQLNPEFQLGTAAAASLIAPTAGNRYNDPAASHYRSTILELFNMVTDAGTQQWNPWITDRFDAIELAEWAVANQLSLRGHSTIWGDVDGFPTPPSVTGQYKLLLRESGPQAARDYLMTKVSQWIEGGSHTYFAQTRPGSARPMIDDLDVENHPLLFGDFRELLGQEFIDQAIRRVRQLTRPETQLFINEDQALGRESGGFTESFYDLIAGYLERDVPIDGIGFQEHYDSRHLPGINTLRSNLARFDQFDLQMQVTEFDVDQVHIDRQTQADFTRDFYRTLYAHPDVNAIVMWGFWQGEHWRASENAGLFDESFAIKPNGQAFLDFQKFDPVNLVVGQDGSIRTTLPRGTYQLQVELANGTATTTVQVLRGGTRQQVTLPNVVISNPLVTAAPGSTATNRLTLSAPTGGSLSAIRTINASRGSLQAVSGQSEYLWSLPVSLNTHSAPVQIVIQYTDGTQVSVSFGLNVASSLLASDASLSSLRLQ